MSSSLTPRSALLNLGEGGSPLVWQKAGRKHSVYTLPEDFTRQQEKKDLVRRKIPFRPALPGWWKR